MARALNGVYFVLEDDGNVSICFGNGTNSQILNDEVCVNLINEALLALPDNLTCEIFAGKLRVIGAAGALDEVARAAITEHVNNYLVHITSEEKTVIASSSAHIANVDIHVTSEEKTAVTGCAAHIANADIHVTSEEKTVIANSSAHIANADIHVTAEEKNKIAEVDSKLDIAGGTVTAATDVSISQIRNISAGTTDLTAGVSPLTTGDIYFVYE